jgi:cell wall-associated NlpC family hydrolase
MALLLLCIGMATPATDDSETEAYVVQGHQTIAAIAAEYGISPDDLASYNHLRANDRLAVGQVLMVPVGEAQAQQATPEIGSASAPGSTTLPAPQTLAKNQVQGVIATVAAKQTKIYNKPAGGQVIFDNAVRDSKLLVIDQTETQYAVLMSDGSTGWVPRIALKLSDATTIVTRPTPEAPSATPRQDIVDAAMRYLGIPYKYGGSLPDTIDCSLFVQTVFRQFGIHLPRTAAEQFQVGLPVAPENLIAGDRLYFHERGGQTIGHTAIYIGNGRFIHASSNRGQVAIDELSNPTYVAIYAGARR